MSENRCLIIAEAGVNHNGSLAEAKHLADIAKTAGADIVKFQTFQAKDLVTPSANLASYQKRSIGQGSTQLEMLKKLELSFSEFCDLAEHCKNIGIEFLSTAFDETSLLFLVKTAGIKRIKIPSGELTNGPLILTAAKTGLPLIISTGMATLAEIESALDVITWAKCPSASSFKDLFRQLGAADYDIRILHCTSEYPAPPNELNLLAIPRMSNFFNLPVGLSDHSEGILAPTTAVALGACVIEKHFTRSRAQPGPDHRASLEPNELAEMVRQIRLVETFLGNEHKKPSLSEEATREVARKSLVAGQPIGRGEKFTEKNLKAKRPGNGMSPMLYWDLLGKTASRSYDQDDLISENLSL